MSVETPLQWSGIAEAIGRHHKHPNRLDDEMAPYRNAAYAGQAPWREFRTGLDAWARRYLLRDMAEHAATVQELTATLLALDDALDGRRGLAWITGEAGDVLDRRAKKGTLPEGWADALFSFLAHPNRLSGAFWARSALRAAGHAVAEPKGAELD